MKITESVLRKIIAEEIAVAYEEGRLDEGFFDDMKSKFSGMAGKLFGKKEQPASDTPAAKSSPKMKSSDPYAGELMVAKKRAMDKFQSVEKEIKNVYQGVKTVADAALAKKPPQLGAVRILRNAVPALQSILEFGKQTVMGFEQSKRKRLFEQLKLLMSTQNPGLVVEISEVVFPILNELLSIVQENRRNFDPDKFAEDFYTTRLSREPFKFEGKRKRKTIKESGETPQVSGEIKDTAVVSLMTKLKQLGLLSAVPTSKLGSAVSDIKKEKFDDIDNYELAALGKIFLNLIKSPNDQAISQVANILKGTDEKQK